MVEAAVLAVDHNDVLDRCLGVVIVRPHDGGAAKALGTQAKVAIANSEARASNRPLQVFIILSHPLIAGMRELNCTFPGAGATTRLGCAKGMASSEDGRGVV